MNSKMLAGISRSKHPIEITDGHLTCPLYQGKLAVTPHGTRDWKFHKCITHPQPVNTTTDSAIYCCPEHYRLQRENALVNKYKLQLPMCTLHGLFHVISARLFVFGY